MDNENSVACCACCACLKVVYDPEKIEGGLLRERWVCKSCGMEFKKKIPVKTVKDVLQEHMKKHGFTGIVNIDNECGCHDSDLFPCDNMAPDCAFGHSTECEGCESDGECPTQEEYGRDGCVKIPAAKIDEEKIDLCSKCQYEPHSCDSKDKRVVFGCDVEGGKSTDDNVVECEVFKSTSTE